jgi:RNA polymerase sigma factor (sigma-70 family)
VTFDEALDGRLGRDPLTVVAFDRALQALEAVDPRAAQVLECRVFGGLEVAETAESLDISTATVKRDFRFARAFLADELS